MTANDLLKGSKIWLVMTTSHRRLGLGQGKQCLEWVMALRGGSTDSEVDVVPLELWVQDWDIAHSMDVV